MCDGKLKAETSKGQISASFNRGRDPDLKDCETMYEAELAFYMHVKGSNIVPFAEQYGRFQLSELLTPEPPSLSLLEPRS